MPRARAPRALGWLPILLAAAVALSACSALPSTAPVGANASPADRVHGQAQEALARWADAVARSGGASITSPISREFEATPGRGSVHGSVVVNVGTYSGTG